MSDPLIMRDELRRLAGGVSSETIRRCIPHLQQRRGSPGDPGRDAVMDAVRRLRRNERKT